MGNLTIIMKVTNRCNYKCSYCYIDERAPRQLLSVDTATLALQKCFHSAHERLSFIWHGGEPLLRGIDFFRQMVELQRLLHAETGKVFRNSIQTNASLLTPEIVRFLKENEFHIGTSLDGPPELNDSARFQMKDGSHHSTLMGIRLIQDTGTPAGAIATITRLNFRYPTALYHHFKANGIHLKVGDLVNAGEAMHHTDLSVTPEEYGAFSQELFRLYAEDAEPTVSVNPFDGMIRNVVKGDSPLDCIHAGNCHHKFVAISPNGDMYPCGYYQGLESFKYGNIAELDLDSLDTTPAWQLLERRANLVKELCGKCEFYSLCHGGCPFRAHANGGNILDKDHCCEGFKMIFRKVVETVHSAVNGTNCSGGPGAAPSDADDLRARYAKSPESFQGNAVISRALNNRRAIHIGHDSQQCLNVKYDDEYTVHADVAYIDSDPEPYTVLA